MATILLVDDEPWVAEEFAKLLPNHALLCAHTVNDGRALFKKHRHSIDLILFDGYMDSKDPSPTTLGLIAEIRALSFERPMVAISRDLGMRSKQLNHGCTSAINKTPLERLAAHVAAQLAMK